MRIKKRAFHAIVPQNSFTFHLRNDIPPRKGDLTNDVVLHWSTRSATIVICVKDNLISWGIARCEWGYQFCKKLARAVATGRAKQAFVKPAGTSDWYKQGVEPFPENIPAGKDEVYNVCREKARLLICKLNARSEKITNTKITA
jgi:hypothetical protein